MGQHQLRQGKTMSYSSADGVTHPASFWCLDDPLVIMISGQQLRLRFIGWHDIASYDADREPIAGAVKDYILSGAEYDMVRNLPTQHPQGTPITLEVVEMAWQIALNKKDQGEAPVAGKTDLRTSFFETAVNA